ncbi:MAG TPA: hypothetical protein VG897_07205 [Terriglobales bacterium]|nr:hypothetical protein [Terriglobales bacterium]
MKQPVLGWNWLLQALRNWNWKAALLSAIARVPIFFFSTIHYGLRAMSLAAAVEFAYRISSSGYFGSFIQSRRARGTWFAAFEVTVLVPTACLSLDYLVHWLMHTPNLKVGIAISFAMSSISSLFNWYSMKKGILITGSESSSLLSDLKRLPWLIAEFIAAPPMYLWRRARQLSQTEVN